MAGNDIVAVALDLTNNRKVFPMNAETKTIVWTGVGGLILGAVIAAIIGFSPLVGWKTKAEVVQMVDREVMATKTAICAAQFRNAPNYAERLKELKALSYGEKKSAFFAKGGWDKIPGEEKTSDAVTQACISRLEDGVEK